jgi:hypothetical protein
LTPTSSALQWGELQQDTRYQAARKTALTLAAL